MVCGNDTGARDMDASQALGPKQRLHRCLGTIVVLLNVDRY